MQNKKIKILSTGTLSNDIFEIANKESVELFDKPMIEITEHVSPFDSSKIKNLAAQKILAIFTSLHAVTPVIKHLKAIQSGYLTNDQSGAIPATPSWDICCLDGKIKEAAIEYWEESSIIATAKNANELSEIILQKNSRYPIVFFCGNRRMDALPTMLANHPFGFEEIAVYQTILTPKTIKKYYDTVVFFSPSAVESFFSKNKLEKDIPVFCIGQTTSAEIKKYCNNKINIAKKASKKYIIEEAIKYFQTKKVQR